VRRVVLIAAFVIAAACNTPSIPIPPPEPGLMAFDLDVASGMATYSYGIDPDLGNATVYVFNRSKGVGVIDTSDADGSVGPTASFPAEEGDEIVVTFELEEQLSSICVFLSVSGPLVECTP